MIRLSHVSRLYPAQAEGGGVVRALDDISLEVAPGEWLAVMGPSGSGKSTLANLIGCLDRPTSGEIWLDGENVAKISTQDLNRARAEKVGFIFQQFHLIPYLTALENVMLPQMVRGLKKIDAQQRGHELLGYLGLKDRVGHRPGELSGGEQQRVAIARAVANAPRILLADEPTGNLDPRTSERVFSALTQLVRASGLAAIIATHNMDLASRMDRRVTLRDGKVVEME